MCQTSHDILSEFHENGVLLTSYHGNAVSHCTPPVALVALVGVSVLNTVRYSQVINKNM